MDIKCGICLSSGNNMQEPVTLPCHKTHVFCGRCITRWFEVKRNCPICQAYTPSHDSRPLYQRVVNKVAEVGLGAVAAAGLTACIAGVNAIDAVSGVSTVYMGTVAGAIGGFVGDVIDEGYEYINNDINVYNYPVVSTISCNAAFLISVISTAASYYAFSVTVPGFLTYGTAGFAIGSQVARIYYNIIEQRVINTPSPD